MIVKNEESCIQRALLSIREVDEIVVLDTGSTDDTAKAVSQLNLPNVRYVEGEYKWKDDFSDARNASLARCTGDWRLVIDADERIQDGGIDRIREFMGTSETNGIYLMSTAEDLTSSHSHIRVIKKGVVYKSAAHEYPLATAKGECATTLFYGKSDAHKSDSERMMRILSREYAKSPDDSRTCYYLAREYYYRSDMEAAIPLFQRCCATSKFRAERADAFLYLSRIFWKQAQGDKARDCCLSAININSNFAEAMRFMAEISWEENAIQWRKFSEIASNDNVMFVRK